MNITHERFIRVLLRCVELTMQAGINPAVVNVYKEALAGPAGAYLSADSDVSNAIIACEKESREALSALISLDSPYRVARSALKAIHPETMRAVPNTLKAQPTDTDQLKAIEWLVEEIKKHTEKKWADDLIKGEFGVKVTSAIDALKEAIEANKTLTKAKMDRAAAYEAAYARYLDFKQVVRDALGATSKEYKRIHLRALPKSTKNEPEDTPKKPEGAPAEPKDATKKLEGAPTEPKDATKKPEGAPTEPETGAPEAKPTPDVVPSDAPAVAATP